MGNCGVSTDSASCSVVRFTWTRTVARCVGGGGGVAGGTGREEEQALASRLKAVEEEGRSPNMPPTPSLLWLSLGGSTDTDTDTESVSVSGGVPATPWQPPMSRCCCCHLPPPERGGPVDLATSWFHTHTHTGSNKSRPLCFRVPITFHLVAPSSPILRGGNGLRQHQAGGAGRARAGRHRLP